MLVGAGPGLEGRGEKAPRRLRGRPSAVRAIYCCRPPGPPDSQPAPSPPAAVTRETGRDRLPTPSWFHGSREESSFGAIGGSSGPGHQLDALFGEPGVPLRR